MLMEDLRIQHGETMMISMSFSGTSAESTFSFSLENLHLGKNCNLPFILGDSRFSWELYVFMYLFARLADDLSICGFLFPPNSK